MNKITTLEVARDFVAWFERAVASIGFRLLVDYAHSEGRSQSKNPRAFKFMQGYELQGISPDGSYRPDWYLVVSLFILFCRVFKVENREAVWRELIDNPEFGDSLARTSLSRTEPKPEQPE